MHVATCFVCFEYVFKKMLMFLCQDLKKKFKKNVFFPIYATYKTQHKRFIRFVVIEVIECSVLLNCK